MRARVVWSWLSAWLHVHVKMWRERSHWMLVALPTERHVASIILVAPIHIWMLVRSTKSAEPAEICLMHHLVHWVFAILSWRSSIHGSACVKLTTESVEYRLFLIARLLYWTSLWAHLLGVRSKLFPDCYINRLILNQHQPADEEGRSEIKTLNVSSLWGECLLVSSTIVPLDQSLIRNAKCRPAR